MTHISATLDWFSQAKYGLFVHFLPSGEGYQDIIDTFDVEQFAADCAEAGAAYLVWTLGQNSGYFCAPSASYDTFAGRSAGDTCSTRDLPGDLIGALGKYNIKLMLYAPGDPPAFDKEAAKGLGATEFVHNFNGENWGFNDTMVERWGSVIAEWSERYGDRISGWWLDGCYRESGFTDDHAAVLARSVKHGNSGSIVAFNTGINFDKVSDSEDYLAGETVDLLTGVCEARFKEGAQWHELSFLGEQWGSAPPRYTAAQISQHLMQNILPNGGVLTLDIPIDGSRIESHTMRLLAEVRSVIRK